MTVKLYSVLPGAYKGREGVFNGVLSKHKFRRRCSDTSPLESFGVTSQQVLRHVSSCKHVLQVGYGSHVRYQQCATPGAYKGKERSTAVYPNINSAAGAQILYHMI